MGWFNRPGFTAWRLGTFGQYAGAILTVLTGILVFVLIVRRMRKNRTPEAAGARVAKRLKMIGGKGAKVYRNVIIRTSKGDCPAEMVFLARDKLHPVKVLYRGTNISGQATGERWTLYDQKRPVRILNPLIALNQQRTALLQLMEETGMGDIAVEPLVVCAENFESPRVSIQGFASAVPYQQLFSWRRKHPLVKKWFMDTEAVDRVLTAAFIQAPKPGDPKTETPAEETV